MPLPHGFMNSKMNPDINQMALRSKFKVKGATGTKKSKGLIQQKRQSNHKGTTKRFKCHLCGKRFDLQYRLTRHVRTHTDEKPYNVIHLDILSTFCLIYIDIFGLILVKNRTVENIVQRASIAKTLYLNILIISI